MEKPAPVTVAWYTDAVPEDPRVVKGQMFGHPCAFVGGNMFLGTFAQSVVARVGEVRAATLVKERGLVLFEPMPGRAWKDYVRMPTGSLPDAELAAIAAEALAHTLTLPPKAKKPAAKRAR